MSPIGDRTDNMQSCMSACALTHAPVARGVRQSHLLPACRLAVQQLLLLHASASPIRMGSVRELVKYALARALRERVAS